jgi:hypothetical protein
MKKIIGILSLAILINFNATSQSFEIGDNVLGIGIGIGGNYGYSSLSGSPSIGLYYENGVTEIGTVGILGIGGYLGYKSYKDEYSYFGYSAKGAFHYTGLDVEKFDPYAGLMLGYNIASSTIKETGTTSIYSNSNYNDASGSVNFSGFVGARYFLTNNVAAYAELGFGVSNLTVGAAFKF